MQPLVSVIVPVFKVEQYIDRTMNSLLNQTLKNIEIILVDDGSPDNCPQICDSYAKKYNNIKVIHKTNEGLGMACNSGIGIATGEYIAFCDSDDYVDVDMYESMYNIAKRYNTDAVFSGIKTVDQNGSVKPMNEHKSFKVYQTKNEINEVIMDMIASSPEDKTERNISMSAKIVLYRKSIIDNNNLRFVNERKLNSEDLIWNIDFLYNSNCIILLPQTFYYYYCNYNSLSKSVRKDRFELYKILYKELYIRYNDYKLPLETRHRIDKMFIGYCRHYIGTTINSNLSNKEKRYIVNTICKDSIWKTINKNYPLNKMYYVNKIIYHLMLNNSYWLLFMVFKFKNKLN